ncbi:MAG: hypothetical protein P4L53_06465 [Candidatus Obscuribacterales bacterium]|nr:hypothetical protein [Candidatus Obscuribacterales bacterium]
MLQQYWQIASDFVLRMWHTVHWMSSPQTIAWSVGAVVLAGGCLALWNMSRHRSLLEFWSERIERGPVAPKNARQFRNLWVLALTILVVMVVSLGGPNLTGAPLTVPKGAVQVIGAFDVSNSMAALAYRPFYARMSGQTDPGPSLQWGTSLDAAKSLFKEDLLPQLTDNEVGLIAAGGVGYNTWDITRELSEDGAFMHMLNEHLKVGAAPFGGSDYADALQKSLDEFALVSKKERDEGDRSEKTRFIVLFGDGGNTSKPEDLDKVLAEINKQQIHLLIVEVGGSKPMSVPKYDSVSHRANSLFFMKVDSPNELATTMAQPVILTDGQPAKPGYPIDRTQIASGEKVFLHMLQKVNNADLIYAPPGTMHIYYSFPEKLGGLVAVSNESNIRPWLLLVAFGAFVITALGGGGLPRWRLFMPEIRPSVTSVFALIHGWFKFAFARKR